MRGACLVVLGVSFGGRCSRGIFEFSLAMTESMARGVAAMLGDRERGTSASSPRDSRAL